MPHLLVNRKIEPLLVTPKPIKVAVGGRGSGKSIAFGDIFTMKMETERCDVLCLREFQDSVNDSVHRVFASSIEKRLKLEGWSIQENKVVSPFGNKTLYKGANRNPDSMQSAQDYKYSWFEEAHRASKSSLDKLLPTIIRNPGAECWFSANPQSSGDPFSQRFIVPYKKQLDQYGIYEDDMHLIVVVNWRDNPWWNDEQEKLRRWDYENRPRAEYDWIWEGQFNDSVEGSIIRPEWFDAAIDAHKLDRLSDAMRPHGAKIASLDPFDGGGDAAGYALRHGSIITKVLRKDSGEIDEVCDWATDEALRDGADWFVWDGDGMGTGLKGQIAKAFNGTRTKWHMFRGSLSGAGQDNASRIYMPESGDMDTKPKTYAETFKNNRAQFYSTLANRFYNTYRCVIKGHYIDPDAMISIDRAGVQDMVGLRAELCRIPRKPNGAGLVQIMSKDEMKRIGIQSPNMSDAVMMCEFTPIAEAMFEPIQYSNEGII
jgi:phage terminase large subunit